MEIIVVIAGLVGISLIALALVVKSFRRRARRLGFEAVGGYLRAVPVSDSEKRDAVDMAFSGVVLCLLGLVFPPFLLIGLFPLYYGARKMAYALMGLGLVDDAKTADG